MFGSGAVAAQESRGSIAGLVVDSSGGALPGVTVTIRNNGTNATVVQTTNSTGQYTAVLLLPGTYTVSVELSGFQKREYQNVQVHVGERVQLDATLAPASVTESVLVVGESPQLEAGSATIGQVINSTLISEIPLGDGTAYGLTRLIPGASFERSYALQRPMDNDNLRGMTITGTINSEFTIDGSSNVVSQARAGIQPPSDAIEEFKVETAAYDAQVGHTGAGAVNLALKTGTNQFHGSASFYNRDDSRSANLFASNRSGSGKTPRNYNRFSGGDRWPDLPEQDVLHVLVRKAAGRHDRAVHQLGADGEDADGRFLRAAVERRADLRSAHSAPGERRRRPGSVPGQYHPGRQDQSRGAQRARDTSGAESGRGRRISPRISLSSSPGPMRITSRWCGSITNGRSNQRTYGRFIRNFRREERFNFAGEIQDVEITRGATDRFNFNYAVGHTAVLSPTTVFDLKGSWLRFNDDLFPLYTIDPASLGFSASTAGSVRRLRAAASLQHRVEHRRTTAGRVARLGAQQSGFNSGRAQPFYNVQIAPTLTKTAGAHTFKIGYDWRQLRQAETNLGWKAGAYGFDGSYTRSTSAATSQYGQGIAAFMLGIPTTNSVFETRSNYDARVNSHGAFVHDDWRVSDRLTLNLGLRYDLEIGLTEVENRNIGGFDLTTPNPIEGQARANFAANPPAGVPIAASAFNVRGGYTYLSGDQQIGVECGQEQLPAARGLHLQAYGKLGSAGRGRALHRAVSDSGCAGHHDRAQSNRVLA